ncbi:hypothetical protein PROFUN_11111 [Planoprotostelium fungivorum]|uniref:Uncharacterized protein n=1 Tax=Planoprotostelium fungivorum TaxID=1890364 RepID=A0A2P6NAS1_9EUKA|nr:hypothetical protein PROFUN_11111 [Planoprotostelium fungivorum]
MNECDLLKVVVSVFRLTPEASYLCSVVVDDRRLSDGRRSHVWYPCCMDHVHNGCSVSMVIHHRRDPRSTYHSKRNLCTNSLLSRLYSLPRPPALSCQFRTSSLGIDSGVCDNAVVEAAAVSYLFLFCLLFFTMGN